MEMQQQQYQQPPYQYSPQQYQQYPPQQQYQQYPPAHPNQIMPMAPMQAQQQMVTVQMPAIYFKDALGKLEEVAGVFIKQKFELLEAMTGCETENKYVVYAADKDGDIKKKMVLFKCKEKSGFFERQCLAGNCRPFKAKVEHESKVPGAKDGEKCLEFERECTCTIWCLWRPLMKVYLTEDQAKKRYLGKVINPCTFCDLQLDIYNEKDEMEFKVIGSCCQLGLFCQWPCKACQTIQFYVHDAKTGERLTELTKKTAGCLKSAISDADNFSLVFPKKASKEMRAVLMAAVIMLDFMYFEEKPNNNSNNSASKLSGLF